MTGRPPLVRLLVWVVRLALAAAAASLLARLLGGGTVTPLPQLAVFLPYAAAVAAVALLGALALRIWRTAAVAAVLLAVPVALLVPRFVADPGLTVRPGARAAGDTLRVMTANVLAGGADAEDVVAMVRREAPDVLAVEELTPAAVRRFDAAGLAKALPHRILRAEPGVAGMGLYSRLPLRATGVLKEPTTFAMPWAVVDLPAGPVRIQAVHTFPPLPLREGRWSDDLAALARRARVTPGRQVLLGDFNATLDHGPFRKVLAAGPADVHDALGRGLVRTWPSGLPLFHLDHVLFAGGLKAVDVHERTVPGTDHLAVVAELRVPSAGSAPGTGSRP
ncbi:endonuclease/exonuclease/phosphatase family protein [Streptomyces chattanoogensis]|uniref:endonuclease/exonuclease/phosphatase family protein n=1 Tax=Streptomyces chattanoogensis TaxID=66876 RepID=UPI003699C5E0